MERFYKACEKILMESQIIRQDISEYLNFESNKQLFDFQGEGYEKSFASPDYLKSLGYSEVDLLSVIYVWLCESLTSAYLQRPLFVWNKQGILRALKDFSRNKDRKRLQAVLNLTYLEQLDYVSGTKEKELMDPDNAFYNILMNSQKDNLKWMCGYGTIISPDDIKMYEFYSQLSEELIDSLATHIVVSFFHGFISQSREIGNRNFIRMIYSIGQERLAKAVVNKFREKGFFVILYKPSSSSINPKFIAEHKLDTMAYTDEKCYQEDLKAYKNTMFNLIQEEGQICGYVKIAQFGKKLEQVASSSFAFKPEEKILNAYLEMYNEKRRLEASIIKPDTISFCSITFPEKNIGLDFEEIFESFCQINLQDSYPFEQVQKVIIDELDKCQFLHIEGRKNNKTNLTIKLPELKNPQKETLFLNCGGDLNVPYGELFTTPELKGTRGKLYIEKIYLNNVPYEKLELDFEDGKIVKSTCKNFGNEKENEEYVKQELLQGKKDVTIGEAAIGTNTLAYSVSRKYDILFRMPILLLEKMGPHIAVGDPCFARGEKSSVFDLYTSKEMIARYNEETKKGNYLNFHTDITLPYGEIKKLYGETKTGEKILIMKNGLFVLKGTKLLNENLNLTKEDK